MTRVRSLYNICCGANSGSTCCWQPWSLSRSSGLLITRGSRCELDLRHLLATPIAGTDPRLVDLSATLANRSQPKTFEDCRDDSLRDSGFARPGTDAARAQAIR